MLTILRYLLFTGFMVISLSANGQIMTVITRHIDGSRDTIKFGFVEDATLDEDIALGEQNIFMTPVNGYEGRILQRDSGNYSCAIQLDWSKVYYPGNFDTKINYRNPLDTSLQNRFFETWYSDNQTYSLEFICDIPIKSFLLEAYLFNYDCGVDPPLPGIWSMQNDTIKHAILTFPAGLGIKQQIFITNPNITTSTIDEKSNVGDNDIIVYPNPTNGTFYFQQSTALEIERISVYNFIGEQIEQFDSLPIDSEIGLDQFSNGPYLVVFSLRNGEQIVRRVIKQ